MIGLDTSFLVALSITDHAAHASARDLFRAKGTGELLALTPDVLAEFIHAVTDPRRFPQPFSMREALADARAWWTANNVHRLAGTPASVTVCLEWMDQHRLGRKRILDTMLAATLHTAGVRRLFTLNPSDFLVFGVFDLLVP
jgi:predicted nucleic acid-binding protein